MTALPHEATARETSRQPLGLLWVLGGLLVLGSAAASVALPLATYTLSLAMFGLAHVLCELRYVRARFGGAMERRVAGVLGVMLTGVVGLRLARLGGLMPGGLAASLELGFVFLMSVSVLPALWRRGALRGVAGALLSVGLLIGLLLSPIGALLTLAVLHNLTPLGFLVDALDGPRRGAWLALAVGVFVGMPLLIATGLPFEALASVAPGLIAPQASVLPAGPLEAHLGAYLPRAVHEREWAQHAFSGVVFAQCMHYAVVIHLLPRLLPDAPDEAPDGWPRWAFGGVVALAGAGLLAYFWADFATARSVYGVAAAVHAWVEIPVLMLALLGAGALAPRQTTLSA